MGTDLEGAIRSIPSYVDVADHVLVLVPSLYHFDTGILAERVFVTVGSGWFIVCCHQLSSTLDIKMV